MELSWVWIILLCEMKECGVIQETWNKQLCGKIHQHVIIWPQNAAVDQSESSIREPCDKRELDEWMRRRAVMRPERCLSPHVMYLTGGSLVTSHIMTDPWKRLLVSLRIIMSLCWRTEQSSAAHNCGISDCNDRQRHWVKSIKNL